MNLVPTNPIGVAATYSSVVVWDGTSGLVLPLTNNDATCTNWPATVTVDP